MEYVGSKIGVVLDNKSPIHFSFDFEFIIEMDKDVLKGLASTLGALCNNLIGSGGLFQNKLWEKLTSALNAWKNSPYLQVSYDLNCTFNFIFSL